MSFWLGLRVRLLASLFKFLPHPLGSLGVGDSGCILKLARSPLRASAGGHSH